MADVDALHASSTSVPAQEHVRGLSNVSHVPELVSEKFASEDPFASAEQIRDPTPCGSLHPVHTTETHRMFQSGSSHRRSSDAKRMGIFATLFRRAKRSSQDPGLLTPSEISYSNTSRESMSRQPLPAHLSGVAPTTPPIIIRRPSAVPRRTMSKFREDLPESGVSAKFPLSPPDSRVQSPDITGSAYSVHRNHKIPSDLRVQSVSSRSALRSDSPVSPVLLGGNVMSQSLASVDSEGSWLSGRPLKRVSNKSHGHVTMNPSGLQRNDDFHGSYEELGMTDDEYFKKLNPAVEEQSLYAQSDSPLGRKPSSTLIALDAATESGDEAELAMPPRTFSDAPELIKRIVGRQPTIVHRQARAKSAEGLLDMFPNEPAAPQTLFFDNAEVDSEIPESPASDSEPMMVERARSVNLGKQHVRHLSAGSAKLFDIQRRFSSSSQRQALQQE